MGFCCEIFVEGEQIYSGNFSEVPEKYRKNIKEDLSKWADSLGKRGLNELIYSHLSWYEKKGDYCGECGDWRAGDECPICGSQLEPKYIHERSKKLDRIIMCVGMITNVEVSE